MNFRFFKGHILHYSLNTDGDTGTVTAVDISIIGIKKQSITLDKRTASMLFDFACLNRIFPQHLKTASEDLTSSHML